VELLVAIRGHDRHLGIRCQDTGRGVDVGPQPGKGRERENVPGNEDDPVQRGGSLRQAPAAPGEADDGDRTRDPQLNGATPSSTNGLERPRGRTDQRI
jgi:hypothetical protein